MEKIDFPKTLSELYAPSSRDFSVVDVPRMSFLMVDGEGDPNVARTYRDAVEALYAVSYGLKSTSRKELQKDYVVPPLEGLWSAENPSSFVRRAKDEWRWTMMILQPSWITQEMVRRAADAAQAKNGLPALRPLRFAEYEEGRAVQILHVGSYDDEGPTLSRLHSEYMPEHHLEFNGPHHEIYLGDPRRADPSRLRTILRQPVRSSDPRGPGAGRPARA